MTDSSPDPEALDERRAVPPGVPGWVKVSGVVVVLAVLVIVAVVLVGGGEHGPGRHG